jgi:hypothetical protein
MRNTSNNLRLIWADKIVLSLAVLIAVIPAIGWGLVALATGAMGANHVLASIGTEGALDVIAVLLAVWAMLRALDFAAGGATYKLFHAEPVADASAIPLGGDILAH